MFRHTGLPPAKDDKPTRILQRQLSAFYQNLVTFGLVGPIKKPNSWLEAFGLLAQGIKSKYTNERIVIFIDELPWMDTPKSNFLEAFSNFWNNFCCFNKNIVLVVCGSASSWILDKVIHGQGGLYDRVTRQIRLSPFTLNECEQFFNSIGITYSKYEIVESYIAVGGIPYYLGYFNRGLSVAQNIDSLFFNKNAKLEDEYIELFSSQFTNPDKYRKVVEVLKDNKYGLTKKELLEKTGLTNNGDFYDMLKALEKGAFISSFIPFNETISKKRYKLIDPFCLFYLKNVKGNENKNNYWQRTIDSQSQVTSMGLAFENVCFNHIEKIKEKLGITGMETEEYQWLFEGDDNRDGAQIDILIERRDNVVNLCEVKFYSDLYATNKKTHLDLMNKREALRNHISKKASISNVLITTFGLKQGEYSSDYPNVITLDDLF